VSLQFSSELSAAIEKHERNKKRERMCGLMSYRRSHERRSRVGRSSNARVLGDIPQICVLSVFRILQEILIFEN